MRAYQFLTETHHIIPRSLGGEDTDEWAYKDKGEGLKD